MNKYQQAKTELRKFVKLKTTMRPAFMDAVEEAIDARTPMKPEADHHCPVCGSPLGYKWNVVRETRTYMQYCFDCGQRLEI